MRLISTTIQKYRNFVEPQTIAIEGDVTALVGKNESGKTTILKALHRLKPANGSDRKFDLTTEYPRWRLARDRRQNPKLADTQPVSATFELSESDLDKLEEVLGVRPSAETQLHVARTYANAYILWLTCPPAAITEWLLLSVM